MDELSDGELIDELRELDGSPEVTVDRYEAGFLNSVLGKTTLTPGQRRFAIQILEKYIA